jgi:hypothetical protein
VVGELLGQVGRADVLQVLVAGVGAEVVHLLAARVAHGHLGVDVRLATVNHRHPAVLQTHGLAQQHVAAVSAAVHDVHLGEHTWGGGGGRDQHGRRLWQEAVVMLRHAHAVANQAHKACAIIRVLPGVRTASLDHGIPSCCCHSGALPPAYAECASDMPCGTAMPAAAAVQPYSSTEPGQACCSPMVRSPVGSTSLASLRASDVARSAFAGVTARMMALSPLMYCLHISSRSCTMLMGWPSMGILVRPVRRGRRMRLSNLQSMQLLHGARDAARPAGAGWRGRMEGASRTAAVGTAAPSADYIEGQMMQLKYVDISAIGIRNMAHEGMSCMRNPAPGISTRVRLGTVGE